MFFLIFPKLSFNIVTVFLLCHHGCFSHCMLACTRGMIAGFRMKDFSRPTQKAHLSDVFFVSLHIMHEGYMSKSSHHTLQ